MRIHLHPRAPALVMSLLSLASSAALAAPPDGPTFHARLKALYDFRPRDLAAADQEKKSAKLDAFWKEVKAQPNVYGPLLRAELTRADHNPYFYFDGSSLLIEISKAPEDLKTAAGALRRVEMPDVTDDGYFDLVHRLGARGADILDLVQPMLDDQKFKVAVPAHAWTMDQRMAVTSCVLLLEPKRVVDALSARLRREKLPA